MILKELHLTDALGRISIFPPLTHNGEVRILTWPQVIDISKIRDIQIVGTSGLIKFWKLEKIMLRTVAVARVYTFLEVRSRDSTWWPDLMWPRHKNFTTDVKLINEKVCQVWLRCSLSFSSYPRKTTGGAKMTPPPTRAKVNQRLVWGRGGAKRRPRTLPSISPKGMHIGSPNFQDPFGHQFSFGRQLYTRWPNFSEAMIGRPQMTSE